MRLVLWFAALICLLPQEAALGQSGPGEAEVAARKLILVPAPAPSPALRYVLLPPLREKRSGNAALLYQRAHSPEWFTNLSRSPDFEKMHDVLEIPLSKLPKDKGLSLASGSMLREIDLAARRTHCDWEYLDRLREDGFGMLIPDVQSFRTYGRLLSLRTRDYLLAGDFDQAVYSLQTHFGLARHVGEAPIFINTLVANAIASYALKDIEELVQIEGAPNLFWALADLPRPLISLRPALEGERIMFEVIFPGMREALKDPSRPPLTVELIMGPMKNLAYVQEEGLNDKLTMGILASRSYPKARQFLLERGFQEAQIEAMTVLQVALMHALVEYDRIYDDMVKWSNQPAWVARQGFKNNHSSLSDVRFARDLSTLAALILPAFENVYEAQVRLERRIALLQTIEALRMHAAQNEGRLPKALAEIKNLPLPLDPSTGEAFHYRLEDGKAILFAPAPMGRPTHLMNVERYDLSVSPRK